jgi:ubiquinone/menaquinone biosynthesis C-methylase UbiE
MRTVYDHRVLPAFQRVHGRDPQNGSEVHKGMKPETIFAFYSSMRCAVQEMCWRSVIPGIRREAGELTAKAGELSGPAAADGRALLEVDPDFVTPRYLSELDIHLMPGSYHEEHMPEDVTQAVIYDLGFDIFSMGLLGERADDIGASIAFYVAHRFPDLRPSRILDLGCLIGHSTLPWKQQYPDAEVHGLDAAAPCVRYAHARAQTYGLDIHFHLKDAVDTGFENEKFDIVYSSMLLHEMPPAEITRLLREISRILKPGGLMLHYELPPNKMTSAYDGFYLDWDSYYNKEPFYKPVRDLDPVQLLVDAGFSVDNQIFAAVPSITTYGSDAIIEAIAADDCVLDERVSRLVKGVRWFCFGARKNA